MLKIDLLSDPELRHAKASETEYIALSHEWGSRVGARYIELNAKSIRVTKNLHDFFIVTREKGTTSSFWIDAVCIDQRNTLERSKQLQRMSNISSSAKEVWAWLGTAPVPASLPLAEVFDLSETAYVLDLSERARVKISRWRNKGNETLILALRHVCHLSYWNRLWIVQEFLLAKSVVIWIGSDGFPGEDFVALLTEASNRDYLYPARAIMDELRLSNAGKLCANRNGVQRTDPRDRRLVQVLANYSLSECSDWHDKIYGLLSLVRGGHRFPADYSVGKVELLMAAIEFSWHRDWPLTIGMGKYLMKSFQIPDRDMFDYSSSNKPGHPNAKWRTIELRIFVAVDRPSDINPRQWICGFAYYRGGVMYKDGWTLVVDMCQCHHCVAVRPPILEPGDKIYELKVPRRDLDFDEVGYVAFRPVSSGKLGLKYLGAISRQGFRSSSALLLHSTPHDLIEGYSMHQQMHIDPINEGNTPPRNQPGHRRLSRHVRQVQIRRSGLRPSITATSFLLEPWHVIPQLAANHGHINQEVTTTKLTSLAKGVNRSIV